MLFLLPFETCDRHTLRVLTGGWRLRYHHLFFTLLSSYMAADTGPEARLVSFGALA